MYFHSFYASRDSKAKIYPKIRIEIRIFKTRFLIDDINSKIKISHNIKYSWTINAIKLLIKRKIVDD